ncbi:MAG: hypothetical protein ACOC0P_01830 [Planctomycetota bacterium]
MSEYDQYGAPPTHGGTFEENVSPTYSGFAISSLIFSVLFFCPIVSQLAGIMFGVIGLLSITASNGRKKGAALAIAGIVISITTGAITWWGFDRARNWAEAQFIEQQMAFMIALEQGDFDAARDALDPSVVQSATDEELAALGAAISDQYGDFVEWNVFGMQNQTATAQTGPSAGNQIFDLPGTMVFINADPSQQQPQQEMVEAIFVMRQQGTQMEFAIVGLRIEEPGGDDIIFMPDMAGVPGAVTPPPGAETDDPSEPLPWDNDADPDSAEETPGGDAPPEGDAPGGN